jgi:hypothetical protein
LIEIYSGSALYDKIPVAVAVHQLAQARLIIVRTQSPPPAPATRRVDHDHRVAGHRMQRVGAAEVGGRSQVVARHRQPDRVDITAQGSGTRAAQCGQFGADRTGHIMDHSKASCDQPPGSVPGNRRRGSLLQCLVGE